MQTKITIWLCSFKRASFFVRFEWPFLRPGLNAERRRAQGLSRRAGRPTRSGLVLIAPSTVPCLQRAGVFTVPAPVSFLLSRTGVMVLSGVSESCRNMAAGAGAAMSRTRSPVKGPATKEARSPEPRPSGTGVIKLLNYGSYAGFAQARRSQVRIPPFLPL